MRNVIFAINLTADGCCDHTKLTGYDDVHEYFTQLMQDAGLLVYGRTTYELMVPFWPHIAENQSAPTKVINEFAQTFTAIDKVVFSRSLERVEDRRTKIVHTDPGEEIQKLKQQEGKNILLGGVNLPSQLIALDLVDEFRFVIQPIIAGEGRRLWEGTKLTARLGLKLVGSEMLKSGCVALRYLKQDKSPN